MWINLSVDEILKELSSSQNGLSEQNFTKNQKKYGKNVLSKEEGQTLVKTVLTNLMEPLTLVLIFVILVCLFIGEFKEVVIISLIIMINLIISTSQEMKAKSALNALEKMTEPKSVVIRGGKSVEISSSDVCVGDIIILQAGNFVPADIRIIESAKLLVDEAALTGESTFIEKNCEIIKEETLILSEHKNMLYSSTFITNGRVKGVVVAVGDETQIGKISNMIKQAKNRQTPLQENLSKLAKSVSIFAFIIATVIFLISVFINKSDMSDSFISAITLAVAIIPESLPVIVSIILALSVAKMAKNSAIIKKLPAVESLGSVDVICTDKTGTLTLNKMSVTEFFLGDTQEENGSLKLDDNLLLGMTLCNDSFTDINKNPIGDPTELALTYFANSYGINELKLRSTNVRISEIPFDSDRKLMSTMHEIDGKIISYTKGAIDQILERCNKIEQANGEVRSITNEDKKKILRLAEKMSKEALRVLAFAYKIYVNRDEKISEDELIFVGAVGMIDPEKEEAKVAIAKAKKAGIKTVMITGDHPSTAYAIAKKLKIAQSEKEVITGRELEKISQEDLEKNVMKYSVFSRVNPEHKVRIVNALQSLNKIVSMTGDGVNDAPSLQAAHIGVAMGVTGTDVAKQASSMILMDDNFGTIIYAVEEGRNIYNKIKRAVEFVLGTNFAEVLGILIAVLAGFAAPLGAIHVLWINLIVESLIAIPISLDVNDKSVMEQKPRSKNESIFANMKASIGIISIFTGLSMFFGFFITLKSGYDLLTAQTVAFAIMSSAPMLYVLSLRTPKISIFLSKPWENQFLCLAIFIGILMNVVLIYSPLNEFFNLTALYGKVLMLAFIGIVLPTFVYEIYKLRFLLKKR